MQGFPSLRASEEIRADIRRTSCESLNLYDICSLERNKSLTDPRQRHVNVAADALSSKIVSDVGPFPATIFRDHRCADGKELDDGSKFLIDT